MSNWIDQLGPQLLTKDGTKPTSEVLAGKSRVALYFSAHWVINFALIVVPQYNNLL